jgi:hypothetical protein
MKSVRYDRTLIYYDGPQVFLARDLSGNAFVGVLIEQSGGSDKYVVVEVIGAFLEMFLRGEIDLLRLMLSRVGRGWYSTEISDDFEGLISLALQPNSLEDFPHLPKPGLYIIETEACFRKALSSTGGYAISHLTFHTHISLPTQPDFEYYSAPFLQIAHHGSMEQSHLGLDSTELLSGGGGESLIAINKGFLAANAELALAA